MDDIKDRILHLMKTKNINATQLAEALNIQRSGISHILSGRNKPGTEFIIKVKETFPEFSLDWLLLGKGPATISTYETEHKAVASKTVQQLQTSLFDLPEADMPAKKVYVSDKKQPLSHLEQAENASQRVSSAIEAIKDASTEKNETPPLIKEESRKVVKLIIVYSDNTFSIFNPSD